MKNKNTQPVSSPAAEADAQATTVHAATPVPWTVKAERGPTGDLRRLDICAKNRVIAGVLLRYHDGQTDVEHEANARLIVAATNHHAEMLALLKEAAAYNRDKAGALWKEINALVQRIEYGQ